jgi:hypothetical protein
LQQNYRQQQGMMKNVQQPDALAAQKISNQQSFDTLSVEGGKAGKAREICNRYQQTINMLAITGNELI